MQDDIQVTFDDLAGVDQSNQEWVEVIDFLKEPKKFTRVGGRIPRSISALG
jgi:cell division protease FtsH